MRSSPERKQTVERAQMEKNARRRSLDFKKIQSARKFTEETQDFSVETRKKDCPHFTMETGIFDAWIIVRSYFSIGVLLFAACSIGMAKIIRTYGAWLVTHIASWGPENNYHLSHNYNGFFVLFRILRAPCLPHRSFKEWAYLGSESIAEKRHTLPRSECLEEELSMTLD